MTKKILTIIFFCILKVQAQDKVYFGQAHNYSTIYSYAVTEMSISADSILTRLDYRLPNKKEFKNYKNYIPEKETIRISKRGKYYFLFNPETGSENEMHCLKITEKKLTYYFIESKESLIKGYSFKRIN